MPIKHIPEQPAEHIVTHQEWNAEHTLPTLDELAGIINDVQHGSRGAGLHEDSHGRLHDLNSIFDHVLTDFNFQDKILSFENGGVLYNVYVDQDGFLTVEAVNSPTLNLMMQLSMFNNPITWQDGINDIFSIEVAGNILSVVETEPVMPPVQRARIDLARGLLKTYQHVEPSETDLFDLGSSSKRFASAYIKELKNLEICPLRKPIPIGHVFAELSYGFVTTSRNYTPLQELYWSTSLLYIRGITEAGTFKTLRINISRNTLDVPVRIALSVNFVDSALYIDVPANTTGVFTAAVDVIVQNNDNTLLNIRSTTSNPSSGFIDFAWCFDFLPL